MISYPIAGFMPILDDPTETLFGLFTRKQEFDLKIEKGNPSMVRGWEVGAKEALGRCCSRDCANRDRDVVKTGEYRDQDKTRLCKVKIYIYFFFYISSLLLSRPPTSVFREASFIYFLNIRLLCQPV